MYELSICIPTFNRERFLLELLESVSLQLSAATRDRVEVVICDNASTDNTKNAIDVFMEENKSMNVSYHLNEANIGFDKNMFNVADKALGAYCWFMGSDDKLAKNAIPMVLEAVQSNSDIYLGDRIICGVDLSPVSHHRMFKLSEFSEKTYELSSPSDFSRFFDEATCLASIFGYLSNIIFRKSKWNTAIASYDENFTGSAFGFLSVLMGFIPDGCVFTYIDKAIVFCRTGNDTTFDPEGDFVARFMVDVDGYGLLAESLFEDNSIGRNGIHCVFRKQFDVYHYAYLRLSCDLSTWKEIEHKLKFFGVSSAFLLALRCAKPLLVIGQPVYKVARFFFRKLSGKS